MSEAKSAFSSAEYWEARYSRGGNSGAGSYGRLAQFKADFLNTFFEDNKIGSVLEFGCGDGNQLVYLRPEKYVGFDISPAAVALCRKRHSENPALSFFSPEDDADLGQHDVTLSLDVLFHLVEIEVFTTYLRTLFKHSDRFVIIYSSNFDAPWSHPHLKHRNVTNFVQDHIPGWHLSCLVKNAYPYDSGNVDNTSFSDFMVFSKPRTPCTVRVPGWE
jgi:SAM-dependent methyltransferase